MELSAAFTTKAANDSADSPLIIRGFANTTSIDRAGDVIPRSAWEGEKAMPNYLKNPIILAYHDHKQPIGKMTSYTISDEGLQIECEISKAAGNVYDLIKDGTLKTFSVGFRCLEADYDQETDVFLIKALELHEVSVVSVPCNQDSTFEVSKSLNSEQYVNFKKQVLSDNSSDTRKKEQELANSLELNKDNNMPQPDITKTLEALVAKMSGLENSQKAADEKAAKEAQEKAENIRKEAQEKRVQELVDKAVGEQKSNLESAVGLIAALEKKLGDNDLNAFAKTVEALQEEVKAKSEEIAQIMAARDGKSSIASSVGKAFGLNAEKNWEAEAEKAVMLAAIKGVGVDETNFGTELIKAVNASSSIQVSSEAYETVFSTSIIRDIQKLLVVGDMFMEMPMSSKKLTMQIEPESGVATWVAATTYGKEATVGNEITVALTDITFETYKLAAKAYMTDETEEDAIISLLPIIRRHLIEAHVKAIEMAFMGTQASSAPAGKPTGLLDFAKIDGNEVLTAATHDGAAATRVTAKMIHALRRKLGLKGLRLPELSLIVSMDAYYDLIEDDEWQDTDQVGVNASLKLQGQVGRIYGMPVVVSSYFPAKATKKAFCAIVYRSEFVVPRQRSVTVERERRASEQRDAYYVTQRLNLQRYFKGNVVSGTYA